MKSQYYPYLNYQKGLKTMVMNQKEQDKQNGKKSDKRGFYAALTICFLAIGIAAWSTYETMSDYFAPTVETNAVSVPQETAVPSAVKKETKTESKTESASAETVEKPDEVPVESAAAPTAEPVTVPVEPTEETEVAAPVTYTPSDRWVRPVAGKTLLAM